MNETLSRTATDDKDVQEKASASICANSDFRSTEIDESELHDEKYDEQRI
jgi:hypothetical protein